MASEVAARNRALSNWERQSNGFESQYGVDNDRAQGFGSASCAYLAERPCGYCDVVIDEWACRRQARNIAAGQATPPSKGLEISLARQRSPS